jgi:hypothetical protein
MELAGSDRTDFRRDVNIQDPWRATGVMAPAAAGI